MYSQPYFMPGYFVRTMPPMMSGGLINNTMNLPRMAAQGGRGFGVFGRLGNSLQAIKKINWGGLINNTSKTLNVVNQAIPLVRQVGPVVNNVKSMFRVASLFKDETDIKASNKVNSSNITNNINNNNSNLNMEVTSIKKDIDISDNSPTFFINS